jgi:hypothetical protein
MSLDDNIRIDASNHFEALLFSEEDLSLGADASFIDHGGSELRAEYMATLLDSALVSTDKTLWLKVLAYAKDDFISVAKAEQKLVPARSLIFQALQSHFPDLIHAALSTR